MQTLPNRVKARISETNDQNVPIVQPEEVFNQFMKRKNKKFMVLESYLQELKQNLVPG